MIDHCNPSIATTGNFIHNSTSVIEKIKCKLIKLLILKCWSDFATSYLNVQASFPGIVALELCVWIWENDDRYIVHALMLFTACDWHN